MENNKVKNYVVHLAKHDSREDGRKFDEYRNVVIEKGLVKTAEGSAKVTIGETVVIAGVKLSIEKPYPDTPENGNLSVNVELSPLSSREFESGPPSIFAIELARVTDRGIRESKAFDTKKLCIEKGEKVWTAFVDICAVNDAGNLFDACSLAAIAALQDTKFPKVVDGSIDYKSKSDESLPMGHVPIGVTVVKIGDKIYVDPTSAEEKAIDARLTITSMEDGQLCALQKGGHDPFDFEDVDKMTEIALKVASDLRKKL